MSTIKSSDEHLILNADGSSKDIKFQANGVEKGSLSSAGVMTATSFAGSGANLTNIPTDVTVGGRKNMVINGAMQVAQRSTSTVAQANDSNEGFATLDRWSLNFGNSAGGTITTSQDTESPAGFGTSIKLNVTTADASISGNEIVFLKQVVEAQNMRNSGWEYTSSSSYVTFSFWVRSSKTGTYSVMLSDEDGGDRQYTWDYTISSADTWEKKTKTIPGESNLDFDNNNGSGLQINFMLGNASGRYGSADAWATGNHWGTSNQVNFLDNTSNIMYLTGVQLELGSTATNFEHRTYGEELSLCRRYFQAHHIITHTPFCVDWGAGDRNTNMRGTFHFDVEMRAAPTQGFLGDCGWYEVNNNTNAPQSLFFTKNIMAGYNDQGANIIGNSADDAITFSAEL